MTQIVKKGKVLKSIEIENVAAEGKCVARVDNHVVFVPFSAPGDIVDLRIVKKKKSFAEARVVNLVQPSTERIDPMCPYFTVCGGCKWQHLPYEKQIAAKENQVKDNLERIGHIQTKEYRPILGAQSTSRYRNKVEFTFSNSRWLTNEQIASGEEFNPNGFGFHVPGRFDKVLDIDICHLMDERADQVRNGLREFALSNNISYYDIRNHEGVLRVMMVRKTEEGDFMVLVQLGYPTDEEIEMIMGYLKENFPFITSLQYVINQKKNDTLEGVDVVTYHGKDFMMEDMDGLKFKIGPKSFFQTNYQQALELYRLTKKYAGLTGEEVVYDLYTGTGTIANYVAKDAKKVVGVEYVEMAIEDAKVNSDLNKIENTSFFSGDMKDVLTADFIKENGQPDVIITDPPRAGMHESVVNRILEAEPKRIVYVSCNPATQARDLQLLSEKYSVEVVHPVDMFPHTHHVENIAVLELVHDA